MLRLHNLNYIIFYPKFKKLKLSSTTIKVNYKIQISNITVHYRTNLECVKSIMGSLKLITLCVT